MSTGSGKSSANIKSVIHQMENLSPVFIVKLTLPFSPDFFAVAGRQLVRALELVASHGCDHTALHFEP
jgi:hypothetical protein